MLITIQPNSRFVTIFGVQNESSNLRHGHHHSHHSFRTHSHSMEIKTFFIICLAIIIAGTAVLVMKEYMKVHFRLKDVEVDNQNLKTNVNALEKRILTLEEVNQKRLPHPVVRGIEDVELELIAMMAQHELVGERSQAMLSLLQRLHRDGAKYDANKSLKEINEETKFRNL